MNSVPVHFPTVVHYSMYGTFLLHLDKVTVKERLRQYKQIVYDLLRPLKG